MNPRLRAFACVMIGALLACSPLSRLGDTTGGGGGTVLADPSVGLDSLDNYQASLVVTFDGTVAGVPTERRDAYEQSSWRSPQAVFTSIESADGNGAPLTMLVGTVGEAQYVQEASQPCFVRWEAQPATGFSPAELLWPVGAARSSGKETINGTPAVRYALDNAALGLPDEVAASGDLWLAEGGGYVIKYSLTLEGDATYFGEGSSGKAEVSYELTQVDARPEVVYPDGCRPVYTGLPVLPDALELNRQPTVTTYLADKDLASVRSFYEEEMSALGWQLDATHESEEGRLGLLFSHSADGLRAVVNVREESPGVRVVASVFGLPAAAAGPGEAPPTPGGQGAVSTAPPVRVMNSLNVLLGSEDEPSVLASYHLEVRHQAPAWTGSAVGQLQDTLTADVEGINIHFKDVVTRADGAKTTEEAYLIDGKEYVFQNGSVRQGIGMSTLTWTLWPLDPVAILNAGASGATLAGTETLDGRTAEVYELTGGEMEVPGGMAGGLVLPVKSAEGKVWVDQATGALLKAVLDYQADVKDADGKVQAVGSGHLEIEVTQIGLAKVALPGG